MKLLSVAPSRERRVILNLNSLTANSTVNPLIGYRGQRSAPRMLNLALDKVLAENRAAISALLAEGGQRQLGSQLVAIDHLHSVADNYAKPMKPACQRPLDMFSRFEKGVHAIGREFLHIILDT